MRRWTKSKREPDDCQDALHHHDSPSSTTIDDPSTNDLQTVAEIEEAAAEEAAEAEATKAKEAAKTESLARGATMVPADRVHHSSIPLVP
jgi:hypothetical protein